MRFLIRGKSDKLEAHLTPRQYEAARSELGWTHDKVARVVGRSRYSIHRYIRENTIPPGMANFLRVLVHLRLTLSKAKFEQIIAGLEK